MDTNGFKVHQVSDFVINSLIILILLFAKLKLVDFVSTISNFFIYIILVFNIYVFLVA